MQGDSVPPVAPVPPTAEVPPARRRVGRPARLDRAAIARASAELDLDQVTMRSVAARLGVSVPSLYHYVRGRDDLLRLAAEQSAARLSIPEDRGQHWSVWLYQWADHARTSFAAQPALLERFMHADFGVDRMLDHLDAALGVLHRQGFTPADAKHAYDLATECAIGAAVAEIRDREMSPPIDEAYAAALADRDADEVPHLRSVLADSSSARQPFPEQVATVLAGVAVRRGEDWQAVAGQVREAAGQP